MAERSCDKKGSSSQPVVSQPTKRLSSSSKAKAGRSKKVEGRPPAKSVSGPTKKNTEDLFAKEEHYKLLNAELEAKTADLVRQAEQLMREQSEVLAKPLSTLLLTDIEDEEKSRIIKPQQCTVQEPGVKMSHVDDLAAVADSADCFLAKTIRGMEEKMDDTGIHENVVDDVANAGDNIGSGVSDAQIRVLKAKLRIMQEELDQLSCEYYKKDDENAKLSAKMKELEEERARLQKTTNIQQTQIEKHRALALESDKKSDGLQVQVSALHKKQAAGVHSTVEVRLNRALEEVERLKTQLNKMNQMNKDKISEEHQSKENLLAENKMLKKQKAELIVGFKKQLKLIDILKRQKMHLEAAKLLSFTEDEFMKALDWGNSETRRVMHRGSYHVSLMLPSSVLDQFLHLALVLKLLHASLLSIHLLQPIVLRKLSHHHFPEGFLFLFLCLPPHLFESHLLLAGVAAPAVSDTAPAPRGVSAPASASRRLLAHVHSSSCELSPPPHANVSPLLIVVLVPHTGLQLPFPVHTPGLLLPELLLVLAPRH
ncbi:hypothetical protein FQN60_010900 [Etheostoma spectabile]|uniref:Testis expressed 9 n=1 Tax=Etheostoma spectabile TaxID=54343 RepID=A0A5J5DQK1_9PERO|nr:hypothetical protein FQN60_010900 [Etheostoma spectabile]